MTRGGRGQAPAVVSRPSPLTRAQNETAAWLPPSPPFLFLFCVFFFQVVGAADCAGLPACPPACILVSNAMEAKCGEETENVSVAEQFSPF